MGQIRKISSSSAGGGSSSSNNNNNNDNLFDLEKISTAIAARGGNNGLYMVCFCIMFLLIAAMMLTDYSIDIQINVNDNNAINGGVGSASGAHPALGNAINTVQKEHHHQSTSIETSDAAAATTITTTSAGEAAAKLTDDGAPDSSITQNVVDQSSSSSSVTTTTSSTSTSTGNTENNVEGTTTQMHTYQRRGKPMNDKDKLEEELASKWGLWNFVDNKKDIRPRIDYYSKYPYRDIPYNEFPNNAWQIDKEYLSQFLPQAKALIERAMETILSEYGYGKYDENHKDKSFQERSQLMFHVRYMKSNEILTEQKDAGATNQKSFNGLVRRILHAIMTEDTFTVVMGGHSSAAGHGNHFEQSYTMQIQRVLEPVFARLGVKMTARNIGMGGLGTAQNSMGAGSIYGRDMDVYLWDSGMTEKGNYEIDLFFRQGLLAGCENGSRIPYISGAGASAKVIQSLYDTADIDGSIFGWIMDSLPETINEEQVSKLPYAARYFKCNPDMKDACRDNKYNGTCWIDNPNKYIPTMKQLDQPGGRASWHPGNREHQIVGRIIAFNILNAAYTAINTWISKEGDNYQLNDNEWHVQDYYNNMRTKIQTNLVNNKKNGYCYDNNNKFPNELCQYPFKARTEHTPRANPKQTSLRSIMKPATTGGENDGIPKPNMNAYDPPDIYNPRLDPPDDAINYLHIIENGNDYMPLLNPHTSPYFDSEMNSNGDNIPSNTEKIQPGLGWGIITKSSPDLCDGSYDSFCDRGANSNCLLYAHNDYRGGLLFDSFSGWGIFTLKGIEHGIVMIKMETWHASNENPATQGWTSINNSGEQAKRQRHNYRKLSDDVDNNSNNEYDTMTIINNYNNGNSSITSSSKLTSSFLRSKSSLSSSSSTEYHKSSHHQNQNSTSSTTTTTTTTKNRKLKSKPPEFCDDWRFQYSINGGDIIEWTKDEMFDKHQFLTQRVVQLFVLMNDPNFVGNDDDKAKDVELAIRMIGCQRIITFSLTHIYWS